MKLDQHPDFFTDEEEDNINVAPTTDVDPGIQPGDTSAPAESDDSSTPADSKPGHRLRKFLVWFCLLMGVALATAFYFRYISPYATDIRANGTVYNVERRGIVFKTFECSVATTSAVNDTTRPYSRTDFSIADETVARRLQDAQLQGTPVTITYSRYFGTLPWRGAYRNVITAVTPMR